MPSEESKAIVLRYFQETVNQHNLSILEDIFSPRFLDRGANEGLPPGPEASRQYMRSMLTAFPDVHDTLEVLAVADDKVAVKGIGVGTHSGEFLGVPATGKQFTWTATMIWQIVDGKIEERWMVFDALSLMIQLGILPQPRHVRVPTPENRPFLPPGNTSTHQTLPGAEEQLRPLFHYLEAMQTGHLALLEECIAPEYIDHGGWIDELPSGLDGPAQEVAILRRAFPDLEIIPQDIFAAGEYAVLRLTGTGTHRGEIFGIAATNRKVTWMTIGIYKVVNGKIRERWISATRRELFQQLGILI